MCVLGQLKMNSVISKSVVVKARYLPDVKGVNRYKYFHRPVILDEVVVGVLGGESIDKKKKKKKRNGVGKPQRAELLPPIRTNGLTGATSTVGVAKNTNALSAATKSTTGQVAKKNSAENSVEIVADKAKRKTSKKANPQELSVPALNSSSSTLPPIPNNKTVRLSHTKRLNSTWPHDESLTNGRMNGSRQLIGERFKENIATKRAQSVSSLRKTETAFLNGQTTAKRASSSWNPRQKPNSIKDFGTQTEVTQVTTIIQITPRVVAPEPLQILTVNNNPNKLSVNTPKATQTNSLDVLTRLSIRPIDTVDDIEQRSKLLELVDEALGETIDKNSRQRVNELIASSARKQAEAWRDSKDFVSQILLPQSIAIANRARSAKSPMEAMANVHFP